MSNVTVLEFEEEWNWSGWTTLDEIVNGGAVDADGSLVLVGSQGRAALELDDDTFVDEFAGDFATVKLDGNGQVLWYWIASSSGSQADVMLGVDTDSNNDVIMGGRTYGFWAEPNPEETFHLAAVKLDGSSGLEVWRYQESPPDSSTSEGKVTYPGSGGVVGVAVDGDDNVFLVGQTFGSLVDGEGDPGDSDFFAMKLDGSDGSEIWRLQSGGGSEFDSFHAVKADSDGNLVAVGISKRTDSVDFVVLRLSGADGSTLWEYSPPSSSPSSASASSTDVLHTVDLDADGNVYVAGGLGAENLQGGAADTPLVLKLNGSTGEPVWTYEGAAASRAYFSSVAVDPATGTVVAVGTTEGTWVEGAAQGGFDFAAVALNGSTGEELSRHQHGTSEPDYLGFVGFDRQGQVLVGGTTEDGTHNDAVAMKFRLVQASEEERRAEWKIGAIVGAAVFLLLLLAACVGCFLRRKKRANVGKNAGVQRQASPRSAVVVTPHSSTSAEVVAVPALPRPESLSPQPAVASSLPACETQCHPPSQDVDASAANPCTETNQDASPEIPAETPAQRLAKRKVDAPEHKPRARPRCHPPVRAYTPYAPAPNHQT
eukprot:g14498.t1